MKIISCNSLQLKYEGDYSYDTAQSTHLKNLEILLDFAKLLLWVLWA